MWYAAADKIVLVISAVYHYWDHRGIFQTFQLDQFASLLPLNAIISSCLYFLGERDMPTCYQKDILIQSVSCFHTCLKLEGFRFWSECEYENEI